MRQTSAVAYCDVDEFVSEQGRADTGFQEFCAAADHAAIPVVWVTRRTRLQMDAPRRAMGHNHPFIAEGGCGVYLPEDYFHLRPEKTLRLGRFTCIPVAQVQPAAAEGLADVAETTGVPVVPIGSLSPRELTQNLGLPLREAELARQRDFDELFFFAGAAEKDVERFGLEARARKHELRKRGVLWSLAIGASLKQAVRQASKLYDRALRSHAATVALTGSTETASEELAAACDRTLILGRRAADKTQTPSDQPRGARSRQIPRTPEMWEQVLAALTMQR